MPFHLHHCSTSCCAASTWVDKTTLYNAIIFSSLYTGAGLIAAAKFSTIWNPRILKQGQTSQVVASIKYYMSLSCLDPSARGSPHSKLKQWSYLTRTLLLRHTLIHCYKLSTYIATTLIISTLLQSLLLCNLG